MLPIAPANPAIAQDRLKCSPLGHSLAITFVITKMLTYMSVLSKASIWTRNNGNSKCVVFRSFVVYLYPLKHVLATKILCKNPQHLLGAQNQLPIRCCNEATIFLLSFHDLANNTMPRGLDTIQIHFLLGKYKGHHDHGHYTSSLRKHKCVFEYEDKSCNGLGEASYQ